MTAPVHIERAKALLTRSRAVQQSLIEITAFKQRLLSPNDRGDVLLSLHAIAQGNHLYDLELEFATQLLKDVDEECVDDVALANDRIGLALANLQRYADAARVHANAKYLHQTVASEMCSALYEVLAHERKLWIKVSTNQDSHPLNAAMQRPQLRQQITALRVAVGKLKACDEPAATEARELIMSELLRLLQLQGRWTAAERIQVELTALRARVAQPDDSLLSAEGGPGESQRLEQEEAALTPVVVDVSGADDVSTTRPSPAPDAPVSTGAKNVECSCPFDTASVIPSFR